MTTNVKNDCLTHNGNRVLKDRYLLEGENFEGLVDRITTAYCKTPEHRERMKAHIMEGRFMPATPVLSNGGTTRGLPISCFLNTMEDSFFEDPYAGIADTWYENIALAKNGGGIGTDYSKVREVDALVKQKGKSSGIIPFIKVQDVLTLAVSQGDLRRGSSAVYLRIDHPEIEEFIDIRRPEGDPRRRCLDIHNGVIITDTFMKAIEEDTDFDLTSPMTNTVVKTIKAKDLWGRLMSARLETGEPYMLFLDNMQRTTPEHHKALGLLPTQSNLCTEITLPTGKGRTAVCCLGSINLEACINHVRFTDDKPSNPRFQDTIINYTMSGEDSKLFVEDCLRFLDNVLQDFIDRAPAEMAQAVKSAMSERSVGLGFMGWHSLLQKCNLPFDSNEALSLNDHVFDFYSQNIQEANEKLGDELGSCPDFWEYKRLMCNQYIPARRFSYTTAIAPTANISLICGECSPGIEPIAANTYKQNTLSGSLFMRNKHLEKLLQDINQDTDEVWKSILDHEGSVQHLEFLSELQKDTFKTSIEIDQFAIINQACDRQAYIDQAQSVNIFVDTSRYTKKDFSALHRLAWKRGLKSLYYCRSKSVVRAEKMTAQVCSIDNKDCEACQ